MEDKFQNPTGLGAGADGGISELSPKTFDLFPQFPWDIRLNIWKMACCEPRIIKIQKAPQTERENSSGGSSRRSLRADQHPWTQSQGLEPHIGLPPLLHTCSESRDVAKKMYRKAYAPLKISLRSRPDKNRGQLPPIIFKYNWAFNPKLDVMYLGRNEIRYLFDQLGRRALLQIKGLGQREKLFREPFNGQSLAIDATAFFQNCGHMCAENNDLYSIPGVIDINLLRLIMEFPQLQEIQLVVNNAHYSDVFTGVSEAIFKPFQPDAGTFLYELLSAVRKAIKAHTPRIEYNFRQVPEVRTVFMLPENSESYCYNICSRQLGGRIEPCSFLTSGIDREKDAKCPLFRETVGER